MMDDGLETLYFDKHKTEHRDIRFLLALVRVLRVGAISNTGAARDLILDYLYWAPRFCSPRVLLFRDLELYVLYLMADLNDTVIEPSDP
jgi:hypothetical protein